MRSKWTNKEKEILENNYNIKKEDLQNLLPNRTWKSILKMNRQLGYSREEHKSNYKDIEYKIIDNVKYKKCNKCERFLPMTNEYYFTNNKIRDKYDSSCKECNGYSFTNNKIIPKEGYRICKKCNRELPNNEKYFPKVTGEKDLRNVCRECSDHYKGFLEEDYEKRLSWSEEDNILFKKRYPNYTNEELRNLFYPNLTDKQLTDKAYAMNLNKTEDTYRRSRKQQSVKISEKLKGVKHSEEHIQKLSETKKKQFKEGICISPWKGRMVSEEEKEKSRQRVKGKWEGEKNPRHINPLNGECNGNWRGGITNTCQFLRENINGWKLKSMKICGYKCVITNYKFDDIHHLYPFRNMVEQAMNNLNLEFSINIEHLDINVRNELIKEVNKIHNKYGLGICLCKEMHRLFHNLYGYKDFNYENFKEFIRRYFDKEFDEVLSNKYKAINNENNYEEAMKKLASFYYAEK